MYRRKFKVRSRNHLSRGKAISVTYSECVSVALLSSMQWTCTILLSVACPGLKYFYTLSHKL
jgi:hypothetical protein